MGMLGILSYGFGALLVCNCNTTSDSEVAATHAFFDNKSRYFQGLQQSLDRHGGTDVVTLRRYLAEMFAELEGGRTLYDRNASLCCDHKNCCYGPDGGCCSCGVCCNCKLRSYNPEMGASTPLVPVQEHFS